MNTGKRIARNATALMTSQLVTWLLTFALTVFLPRYLGAEAIGKLNLASALWAIAAIGITFGLDSLLVKEIARTPERTGELVGNTLILRSALFVVAFVLMTAYVHFAAFPDETVRVIYLIGLSTLVAQWISAVQAGLQGLEEMQYMSVGNIAAKGVITLLCIPLVLLGQSVSAIASTYVVAALLAFGIQLHYLNRLHQTRLAFNAKQSVALMRAGLPHLLSGAFLVVYSQMQVIIIAWLVDERTVGWYGTASQLFGTLLFIPTVFTAAVSPTLSRLAAGSQEELVQLMRRSFDLMLLLGIPVGLGVFVVANPFVALLFGPDFSGTGPVLAVLGIASIFMYQNMLIGQFLISTDKQNAFTVIAAVATIGSILIDLVVVPWCHRHYSNGAIGGAISVLITEVGILFASVRYLPNGTLGRANLETATKALIAGGVMVAATWWSRPYFVGIPIVIGAVSYSAALLALRAVPAADAELARSLATKFTARFTRVTP